MSNRQTLSRRTMLHGMGVALGLPLLDAMIPSAIGASAAAANSPLRLMCIYVPMGVDLDEWTPKTDGPLQFPYTLEPLQKVRENVLVLSGLQHRREDQSGNPHPRASSTFLSVAPVDAKLDSSGFRTDVTIDQLAAKKIGLDTRLSSLELACHRGIGKHASNLSWRAPGTPNTPEINPRQMFLRMFGDPKGDSVRRSILDRVIEDARDLRKDLGESDQGKVDEYLDSVRAIEKQIQATERDRQVRGAPDMPLPEAIPHDFSEHLRVISDLAVLAMQSDATRVASFMYSLENGSGIFGASYRHLDIPEDHHGLTHFSDGNKEKSLEKIKRIDRFHIEQLAYMLEKMKGIHEGDKSLLDNSMILYGSGISWGNRHNTDNVPVLLCGGGAGSLSSGRHITYSKGTPLANLHLSLLDRVGVKMDRLADSTERLKGLTV